MKHKKIFGLAMIFVFVLSISANSNLVVAQTTFVTTNFEASFFLPSGSRRDESYGLYLKQALAPLGIDVNIFAKPWGQYVGDLTHLGSGKTWDFSTVGFSGGGNTPDLIGLYSSTGFWGDSIMQIGNAEWQAWQLAEVGLNQTTDVDALMELVDFELNLTKRYELLTEFNDMYFTKLLWNFPLIAPISKAAMWNGFGGPENELWDTKEGVVSSSFLGAKWEDVNMASQRLGKTNNVTFRRATSDQGKFSLDPFQVVDTSQGTQTDWSYVGGFLTFDRDWAPHPNTAWNWIIEDGGLWDANQTGTEDLVNTTRYTFFLRDDVFWHDTLDMNGVVVPGERLDGLDYNLTLTMYDMSRNTKLFDVNGIDTWEILADWDISTTVFPYDTVSFRVPNDLRTPDDLLQFGSLNPLPDHLLGTAHVNPITGNNDLTYYNSTSELNETSPLMVGMPFNAWNTFEWNSFESFDGNTAVGPYQMVDYEFNIFHTFDERADYWYPNEWYTADYSLANVVALASRTTSSNMNFTLFGNGSYPQEAYYHAYAEDNGDHALPNGQNLKTLAYVVIDDGNAQLIKFEAGDLDWFGSTSQGATTVSSHKNNPGMTVKDLFGNVSARNLYFNLLNDHLKKINVRMAIAHVLDRSKFVAIHDGFGIPWFSVAYPFKQTGGVDWDTIQHPIEYSYVKARDLMRLEGYNAADNNDFIPTANIPDIKDIIDVLGVDIVSEIIGSELLFLFSAFSMISVVLIRKRK